MASFKAKFPILQELFAKNHRGPLSPPAGRGLKQQLLWYYRTKQQGERVSTKSSSSAPQLTQITKYATYFTSYFIICVNCGADDDDLVETRSPCCFVPSHTCLNYNTLLWHVYNYLWIGLWYCINGLINARIFFVMSNREHLTLVGIRC